MSDPEFPSTDPTENQVPAIPVDDPEAIAQAHTEKIIADSFLARIFKEQAKTKKQPTTPASGTGPIIDV